VVGDRVTVSYAKWGGGEHWTFTATALGTDEFGAWLSIPAGTLLRRPGAEIVAELDSVQLVAPGQWSSPTFFDVSDAGDHVNLDVYVDIVTDCRYDAPTWRMVDLDLDVVRTRSGLVEIVDRDEFEQHQVALRYPVDVIAGASAASLAVAAAIERGDEPYATVGWHWLARIGR